MTRSAALAGALIGAIIGVLSLLAFDFGGWAYSVNYTEGMRLSREGYVYIFDGAVSFLLLAPVLGAMGYVGWTAFRGLRDAEAPVAVRTPYRLALAALALVIADWLVFEAVMMVEEPDDWWLEGAFYGPLLGASIASVFLYLLGRAEPVEPAEASG